MGVRRFLTVLTVLLAAACANGQGSPLVDAGRSSPPIAGGSGVGRVVGTSGPGSPSPDPRHRLDRRHVQERDSGRTLHLRVGQPLHVTLPNGGGVEGYRQPSAAGEVLRRTRSSGGYPSGQAAQADFLAQHPGRTDITAVTDAACLHAQPRCMIPVRMWVLHVVVTA